MTTELGGWLKNQKIMSTWFSNDPLIWGLQRKNSQDVPKLVKVDFFSEKFRKINKTGKNKSKANVR